MALPSLLEIDGSLGEGGGQVLRTSLTLSALTGTPVHVGKIRANRTRPGLAPQHLTNVLALAAVCDAETIGASLRSTEIVFIPRSNPRPGNYSFDVSRVAQRGSAGSVTLILQTLMLPLAFAGGPSHITIQGGTHVPWSPSFDYLAEVFLPTIAPMGINIPCTLEQWGFYPAGGGRITATIQVGPEPLTLSPLSLSERGKLRSITGLGVCCNLPDHIAQRMTNRALDLLAAVGLVADIKPLVISGPGPGAAIFLAMEYEKCRAGFSAIGTKGKPAEQVAEEACQELLDFHLSQATVDPYLADQLLLPMALANGRSEFVAPGISSHLATNSAVIRQFIPAVVEFQELPDHSELINVQGIGFQCLAHQQQPGSPN